MLRWRDTPQRSLYRMYEAVVADEWPMLQYEVEYFWHHSGRVWATANLYDPAEDCAPGTPIDPVCHTIVAAIVEELVKSFEWRLGLCLPRRDSGSMNDQSKMPSVPEYIPEWPAKVPRLPEMHPLQLEEGTEVRSSEDMEVREGNAFLNRNVFAFSGEFYTV